MLVPEEFKYLTRCFWFGSHERVKSLDEWVSNTVRLLDTPKKAVVKPFLNDVLDRNLPDKELQQIWNDGGPSYCFPDANELRRVLTMIRDKLAAGGGR